MISPLDSRYISKIPITNGHFSDKNLACIKIDIELGYFLYLSKNKLLKHNLSDDETKNVEKLRIDVGSLYEQHKDLLIEFERKSKHDIVAIIDFVKFLLISEGVNKKSIECVHLGLTSQDIVTTSYNIAVKNVLYDSDYLEIDDIFEKLISKTFSCKFMGRTHGQPAIPTDFSTQFKVYKYRIEQYLNIITSMKIKTKFGGALNDFRSLHFIKNNEWELHASKFLITEYGLFRTIHATQVDNYESICQISSNLSAISSIFIDMAKDIWMYCSYNYIKIKETKEYSGSSAMSQKINPIQIESALGNMKIARMWFNFFQDNLRESMLQRDLSDSTIMRNLGVAFGHFELAISEIKAFVEKIEIDEDICLSELEENYQVLAEPVQYLLRYEGYENTYEKIKNIFKGKKMSFVDYRMSINSLDIDDDVKRRLLDLTPETY